MGCGDMKLHNNGGFWQFGHLHPHPTVTTRYLNDSLDVFFENGYVWGHVIRGEDIIVYQCEGSIEAVVRYMEYGVIKRNDKCKIILIFQKPDDEVQNSNRT